MLRVPGGHVLKARAAGVLKAEAKPERAATTEGRSPVDMRRAALHS